MAPSSRIPVLTCEAALEEIHVFLDGRGPTGAKSLPLRAHLVRCPECDAKYRELVVGIASISSGARTTSETYDNPETERHVRRSLIAPETKHRLRLPRSILPLAIIAVIAILIARSGEPQVVVKSLGGTVYRGTTLVVADESVPASNGDGCSTGVDGRAEVVFGQNSIRFESESSFSIERLDRLAVRMFDGRASASGTALILFASGALDLAGGSASVVVDDVGITIESKSGKVEYSDAAGRHVLTPGTTQLYEHLRMVEVR
ncbi:MAG: hypothetical protein JNL28_05805 [Planctomycetes bacterium]|nr:hypothetical protein [Planctomycetota bacterium]